MYFSIGKIDGEQLSDYQQWKNEDKDYLLKMLALDVI